jgi:hypothetical protein
MYFSNVVKFQPDDSAGNATDGGGICHVPRKSRTKSTARFKSSTASLNSAMLLSSIFPSAAISMHLRWLYLIMKTSIHGLDGDLLCDLAGAARIDDSLVKIAARLCVLALLYEIRVTRSEIGEGFVGHGILFDQSPVCCGSASFCASAVPAGATVGPGMLAASCRPS